jgi:hypothetical protein
MKSLLELYAPMFEAGNRQLKLSDFPEDAQVEWDRISQELGVRRASFVERGGRYYANTNGKGWLEWTGTTWQRAEKPGPNVGPEVGRKFSNWRDPNNNGIDWRNLPKEEMLWDVFSKDFTSYRNNLTRVSSRCYGKNWAKTIERVYGKGSVDRIMSELWRNFWTDHEAIMEIGHYFDVAQQAVMNQDNDVADNDPRRRGRSGYDSNSGFVIGYPLRIGPRYDMPRGDAESDDPWPQWGDPNDRIIRKQRVTDANYFQNVTGYA